MKALSIGLMVLGLMGIALVGVTSPVAPVNKVVIGVLDFETVGPGGDYLKNEKGTLIKELRQNTRVKLVNIRESCGLSDLKRHGYERAERYKNMYQLDMILHSYLSGYLSYQTYFSLIDLYTKKIKGVTIELRWPDGLPFHLEIRGISKKLLPSGDINRVLREKKKASGK